MIQVRRSKTYGKLQCRDKTKIRGCSTPLIQENANIKREWFLSCLILLYRGTGSLGLHVARLVFNTGRLQCEFVCLALYAQR